jgi:Skp family chaperone for outer membrane proteins
MTLLLSAVAYAQTPAAPATPPQTAAPKPAATSSAAPSNGTVAVIDFMRALTENGEGKKATNKLNAEFTSRQTKLQAKQKEGQDAQSKLASGDKVLAESVKADLNKKIEQVSTDLNRMNEDYQREMQEMQQQYLAPIADVVKKVVANYAAEKGYAVVFDISQDANNIIFKSEGADITQEVIVRIDEETSKNPIKAPAAAPSTPAQRPPAAPVTPPKPPTPDPTKKP